MARGYLFISNSTKPTCEVLESVEPYGPNSFSKAAIWAANQMGWELHMGINRNHPELIKSIGYEIKFYNQHTYRNIFALRDNWLAYRNLCRYLKDNPKIDVIHCNTPIGGVVGRLAGKRYKKKVVYTAHGFHFFKGAPLLNRTILKWIEMWLAHYTDVLITINQEDYEASQKFRLKKGGKAAYIPGVGIDLSSFCPLSPSEREEKRSELGLSQKDFVIISIGDLNDNKNTATIISALQNTPENCHILICGEGLLKQDLVSLAKGKGVDKRCHFLGFRKDIKDLLYISDAFIMASKREGLPRSTMEAMAAGLPCIVSDIRGNRDLIEDGKNGFLVSPTDVLGYSKAINRLMDDIELRNSMGRYNYEKIKEFDIDVVQGQLLNIYKELNNRLS